MSPLSQVLKPELFAGHDRDGRKTPQRAQKPGPSALSATRTGTGVEASHIRRKGSRAVDEIDEEQSAIVGPPILFRVQTDSVATGIGNETTETTDGLRADSAQTRQNARRRRCV
ncbi:hypothetical protein GCM10027563_32020 [Parasphingorhabdus pacifica]